MDRLRARTQEAWISAPVRLFKDAVVIGKAGRGGVAHAQDLPVADILFEAGGQTQPEHTEDQDIADAFFALAAVARPHQGVVPQQTRRLLIASGHSASAWALSKR